MWDAPLSEPDLEWLYQTFEILLKNRPFPSLTELVLRLELYTQTHLGGLYWHKKIGDLIFNTLLDDLIAKATPEILPGMASQALRLDDNNLYGIPEYFFKNMHDAPYSKTHVLKKIITLHAPVYQLMKTDHFSIIESTWNQRAINVLKIIMRKSSRPNHCWKIETVHLPDINALKAMTFITRVSQGQAITNALEDLEIHHDNEARKQTQKRILFEALLATDTESLQLQIIKFLNALSLPEWYLHPFGDGKTILERIIDKEDNKLFNHIIQHIPNVNHLFFTLLKKNIYDVIAHVCRYATAHLTIAETVSAINTVILETQNISPLQVVFKNLCCQSIVSPHAHALIKALITYDLKQFNVTREASLFQLNLPENLIKTYRAYQLDATLWIMNPDEYRFLFESSRLDDAVRRIGWRIKNQPELQEKLQRYADITLPICLHEIAVAVNDADVMRWASK